MRSPPFLCINWSKKIPLIWPSKGASHTLSIFPCIGQVSAGTLTKQVENGFSGVVVGKHKVSKPETLAKVTQTFVLVWVTGKATLPKMNKE